MSKKLRNTAVASPYSCFLDFRQRYEHALAPWACRFRGDARPWPQREKYDERLGYRTEFQMDRDDILYSKSFRQLAYKRQMLSDPDTVSFYTRLTHTLIVSQIARSISRGLQVDENLTEAIALGHDIGHAPYGHSGEEGIERFLSARLFPHLGNKPSDMAKSLTLEDRIRRQREVETHGNPQKSTQQASFLPSPSQPIAMLDLERYFHCRPADKEIYSHHKQGYRLARYLERDNRGLELTLFTYYGILRCSGSVQDDDNFDFPSEHLDTNYRSYEAQTVRLADDIAWANHDLIEDSRKIGKKPTQLLNDYYRARGDQNALRRHIDDLTEFLSRGPGERYGVFISDAIEFNKNKLVLIRRPQPDGSASHTISLSPDKEDYLRDMKTIVSALVHGAPDMKSISEASAKQVEDICTYLDHLEHFAMFVPPEIYRSKRPDSLLDIERWRAIVDAVSYMTDSEAENFDRKHLAAQRLPLGSPRKGDLLSWLSD